MDPESYQFVLVRLWHVGGGHEQNTSNYTCKVTQVEDVVRLGGCGQETLDGFFV